MAIRPYTTRGNKTDFDLAIDYTGKGWKRSNGNVYESLKSLGKDLPSVPENVTFTRSDVSVPSPWAALISFDIILKSKESNFGALRTSAVKDWRALLTIIALRELFGLKLEKEEIDLTANTGSVADSEFYSNILSLVPEKHLFKDKSCWNKFIFLNLEGSTIGVFSNSSLLCSNYSYEESLATNKLIELGLMDSNLKFVDPVCILKDDLALSLYMAAWLDKVKRTIPNIPDGETIGTVIDEYIDAIKECHSSNIVMYNELRNNDFIEFDLDFADGEVSNAYELLWNIKAKKMNLIDPELQKHIKVSKLAKSVFVLEGLGKNVVRLMEILGDKCLKQDDASYLDNNNVFLKEMTLVRLCNDEKAYQDNYGTCTIEERDVNNDVSKNKYSYILPIDEKVLNDLPSYVIDKVTTIEETEEEIIVKISLEMDGGSKSKLVKAYKKCNCRKIYNEDLSAISIWPYATISKDGDKNAWKDYYVFSAQSKENKSYTTKVKYDNQANELVYNELNRINKAIIRKVAFSPMIPTFLSIFKNEYSYSGELLGEEKLGIIVLPAPKIESELNKDIKYLIGFDFGTTSTTAFCKRLDDISDKHKFIKFGELVERDYSGIPTSPQSSDFETGTYIGDDDSACYIAYNNIMVSGDHEPEKSFIPAKYPKRKAYLSLYKQNTQDTIRTVEENQSLKYGNIVFDQGMVSYISEEDLIRNLKWGTDRKTQLALSGYLSQIMKQVAFTMAKNQVGSISWRFSYPTSLSKREYATYKKGTQDLVEYIGRVSGLESKLDSTALYPESIASAKFYDNTDDYISFDIGGGSTDISLWKKNITGNKMDNIMQFSIGIASRKIFLTGITDAIVDTKKVFAARNNNSYKLNQVQEQIKKLLKNEFQEDMSYKFDEVKEKIESSRKLNDSNVTEAMMNFAYIIEPLLQSNGKELRKIMETETEVNDRFKQFLLIGFWGTLYYTALSLGKFKNELQETNKIDINLAGNGSMLYDWIQDEYENEIREAFEQVVNDCLGRKDNKLRIEFVFKKDDLKTEAARGLLCLDDSVIDNNELANNLSLISGANCKVKNKNDFYDICPDDEIQNDNYYMNYFEDPEASNAADDIVCPTAKEDLRPFIDILNSVIFESDRRMKFDLDEIDETTLKSNIGTAMKNNINSGTIAPAFVLELEALLRTILGY